MRVKVTPTRVMLVLFVLTVAVSVLTGSALAGTGGPCEPPVCIK